MSDPPPAWPLLRLRPCPRPLPSPVPKIPSSATPRTRRQASAAFGQGTGSATSPRTAARSGTKRRWPRIKALAIPPAWTEVWICPTPTGHCQATGRDDRGRKQYRYHAAYRSARDDAKFSRLIAFGKALPKIRRTVARDMARPGLPRRKVLAAVVKLLETSLIRVGNEEYAKNNHSFGLTTLHDEHVEINGGLIRFEFRGKSGIEHEIDLNDRRLAKIVRQCQDLPGQELFQYLDEDGQVETSTRRT